MVNASPTSSNPETRDFFISYAREDEAWATWTALTLEEAGYTVHLDLWDFPAGTDLFAEIHRRIGASGRTLAIYSPKSQEKFWPSLERLMAAQSRDEASALPRLVPVLIHEPPADSELKNRVCIRLDQEDEWEARRRLLQGLFPQRRKHTEPIYPGNNAFQLAGEYTLGLIGDIQPTSLEQRESALNIIRAISGLVSRDKQLKLRVCLMPTEAREHHQDLAKFIYENRDKRNRIEWVYAADEPKAGDFGHDTQRIGGLADGLAKCDAVVSLGGRKHAPRLFRPRPKRSYETMNLEFRRAPKARPWLGLGAAAGFSADLSEALRKSWYGPTSKALSAWIVDELSRPVPSQHAIRKALRSLLRSPHFTQHDRDFFDLASDVRRERGALSLLRLSITGLLKAPSVRIALASAICMFLLIAVVGQWQVGARHGAITIISKPWLTASLLKSDGLGTDRRDLEEALGIYDYASYHVRQTDPMRQVTQWTAVGSKNRATKLVEFDFGVKTSSVARHIRLLSAYFPSEGVDRAPSIVCIHSGDGEPDGGSAQWRRVIEYKDGIDTKNSVYWDARLMEDRRHAVEVIIPPNIAAASVACVSNYLESTAGVSSAVLISPFELAGEQRLRVFVGRSGLEEGKVSRFYPMLRSGESTKEPTWFNAAPWWEGAVEAELISGGDSAAYVGFSVLTQGFLEAFDCRSTKPYDPPSFESAFCTDYQATLREIGYLAEESDKVIRWYKPKSSLGRANGLSYFILVRR